MSLPIQFFSEDTSFILKNKIVIRKWLNTAILEEKKTPWYINFIFCSDNYLFELNKTYLRHETLTDILTFPYQEEKEVISGDIFISIDRVRENAIEFEQDFEKELLRVMIHGILHLIGYLDHGKKEKKIMTAREDYFLEKISLVN